MSLNDKAINHYDKCEIKEAFKLACKFTLSFSKDELKDIQRAYEVLARPGAYEGFGWSDDTLINKGKIAFDRFKKHIEDRKENL